MFREKKGKGKTHASGRQEHLDEHIEQVRRRATGSVPVDRPLVNDAGDQVTEDRLHEEDLGEELGPDELGTLEVEVIEDLETDSEGHLHGKKAKKRQSRSREEREGRKKEGT